MVTWEEEGVMHGIYPTRDLPKGRESVRQRIIWCDLDDPIFRCQMAQQEHSKVVGNWIMHK